MTYGDGPFRTSGVRPGGLAPTKIDGTKKIGGRLLPTAGNYFEIICRATVAAEAAMGLERLRAAAANLPATLPHPASAELRKLRRRAFGRKLGTGGRA